MSNSTRRTCVSACVLLLAALFSTAASAGAHGDDETIFCTDRLVPGELGVVTVSLAADANFPTAYDTLSIARVDDGKEVWHTCNLRAASAGVTTYFAAEVPPGEYRITAIGACMSPARSRGAGPNPDDRLGTFRVVTGQRSDLGRIVLTYPDFSPFFCKSIWPTAVRSTRVVHNEQPLVFAQKAGLLEVPALPEPWVRTPVAGDDVEAVAVDKPIGLAPPVAVDGLGLVFRTRIGGLLLRSDEGRWTHLATESGDTVLDVMPPRSADAAAIVVGEQGLMARLDREGKFSAIDRGNLPFGNLHFIDGTSAGGWYVVQASGQDVGVYHSATLDAGDWKKLRDETLIEHMAPRGAPRTLWFWRTDAGFAYAVAGGQIHFLDIATGAWTDRAAPDDSRIVDINRSARGLAILAYSGGNSEVSAGVAYIGGLRGKAFVSSDDAVTWTPIGKAKKTVMRAAFIAADGSLLQLHGNAAGSTADLYRSVDDGTTWTPVPGTFERMLTFNELADGRLIATGPFDIHSSTDHGATWQLEFSSRPEKP